MSTSVPAPATQRRGLALGRVSLSVLAGLAIVLLAVLLIGPLWDANGMPNTADGVLHLHRAAEVTSSWSNGVIWPRWYAGGYEGLGIPVFHYYSPLFYELVAPLHLMLVPLDLAAKLVLTVLFLVSAAALYNWLRRLFSPVAGLAGAALYLAGPHFFREYYFQGDYPQTIALFLLPVVLWAITRLYDEGSPLNWLLTIVSIASLAIAHNITAVLGSAFLAAYWISLPLWRRSAGGWLRTAGAAVLGLGLSAFFWMPALADLSYVRVDTLRGEFFHFSRYFVYLADLLAAPPVLDSRATNPPFPYLLGWPAWAALVSGLLVLIVAAIAGVFRRGAWLARWRRPVLGSALGLIIAAVCLALVQSFSTPIWEHLPGLSLLQFPGRLLGPAALAAALAGAAAVYAVRAGRWRMAAAAFFVLAAVLCAGVFLFPRLPFLSMPGFTLEETQAFERTTGNWGLTSTNGYLPRWATPPDGEDWHAPSANLPASANWHWQTPERAVLQSATDEALPSGELVLPLHYFPAWQVRAGGQVLAAEPTADGLTQVTVPSGLAELDVVWHGTRSEIRGRWISLASLALALAGAAVLVVRRRKAVAAQAGAGVSDPAAVADRGEADRPAVLLIVGLLFVLVVGRYVIHLAGLGWFQRTSPDAAVAATAHPLQVDFTSAAGTRIGLLGWDILPGSELKPGGDLRVRLYWQARAVTDQNLHSFVHLTTQNPSKSWVVTQNDSPARIPTSHWRDDLYVVDDVVLSLPLDLPPSTYSVAAGLVDGNGVRLTTPVAGDGLASLEQVAVKPLKAGPRQALQPGVATPAQVGDYLQLQGYDLQQDGGKFTLGLLWQVLQKPAGSAADPAVFVHVVDASGNMIAQFDGPLTEGLPVLANADSGTLFVDTREFSLDPDVASRGQSILVGLYDRTTMARPAVTPAEGAASHFSADGALIIPVKPQ